jgi:hypothetical protein
MKVWKRFLWKCVKDLYKSMRKIAGKFEKDCMKVWERFVWKCEYCMGVGPAASASGWAEYKHHLYSGNTFREFYFWPNHNWLYPTYCRVTLPWMAIIFRYCMYSRGGRFCSLKYNKWIWTSKIILRSNVLSLFLTLPMQRGF